MNEVERIIVRMNELNLALGVADDQLVLEGNLQLLTEADREALLKNKPQLIAYLTEPREYLGVMCKQRQFDGKACGKVITVQRPSGKLAWCQNCFPEYPAPDDESIVPNVEHVVLPLRDPSPERTSNKPAMYVATDLEFWITDKPHIWADKVKIAGKEFVRLTPSVLAWFKQRVANAEAACAKGKLPVTQFTHILRAFAPVYDFAVRAGIIPAPQRNADILKGNR